ncbi:hypothetical protein [Adhaeribacter pallidiroseus]|uniref:Lipoprotein n=1 Tax=Adhaeribacter pallidiroseus TaxID=2072847 RepID=A0A369QDA1_9BACT|nr:hypothetical protein [Adhaeribacter pallidiroseus]RDC62310.1 hypothetical protein AHMF7616_00903 [Adhaeribacter pallidiroseus]
MKKFLDNVAFVMCCLMGCTAQPPTKQMFEPASTSNCTLPDTKWLKVVNGYDSKTVVDLATKLEAAAKADADKIKNIGAASASGSFTSDFSKIVNANSQQMVEVSPEFYEGYRSKRDALCTLYSLLDRSNISDATRAAAEKQFLEINESWSKIKDNEQKKTLNR